MAKVKLTKEQKRLRKAVRRFNAYLDVQQLTKNFGEQDYKLLWQALENGDRLDLVSGVGLVVVGSPACNPVEQCEARDKDVRRAYPDGVTPRQAQIQAEMRANNLNAELDETNTNIRLLFAKVVAEIAETASTDPQDWANAMQVLKIVRNWFVETWPNLGEKVNTTSTPVADPDIAEEVQDAAKIGHDAGVDEVMAKVKILRDWVKKKHTKADERYEYVWSSVRGKLRQLFPDLQDV